MATRTPNDDRTPAWRRYLRFWRTNPAADVSDELEFHLQSTIDELVAGGMSRDAARAAARKKFGDVRRIAATLNILSQQRERHMARAEWWDTIRQDLAYGLRQLRKAPAFTSVAVLTLALGIGATSAIFSVVYSVLLKPLPYANGDRIVTLWQQQGSDRNNAPFGNFLTWQREGQGFDAMGALWGGGPMTLSGVGEPTPIPTWVTSAGYWKAVFIAPAVGRYFTETEDRDGGPKVVILSYALWQNRFGGDRRIVGRTVTLDGDAYAVVGVAPAAAVLDQPAERMWAPLAPPAWRATDFADHELRVYGRLKAGTPLAAAVRQLATVETRLAREHPHSGYDGGIIALSLEDTLFGDNRETLYLLLGAVALVLLIACGNIANLLLARANVRRTEIAVRGALGASRQRIVGQLLVESGLLALGGGALGLALATGFMKFLVASPVQMPRLQEASLDAPVLAFTVALVLVCSMVWGWAPAVGASRLDLQQTLRDGGRESRGAGRDELRRALVISELSIAQILLIGAGLLVRSSMALQSVPIGFDTHNLVAIDLSLPQARYANDARVDATYQAIEDGIAAIPGVKAVGRTQEAPIAGGGWNWTAFREGSDAHDAGATVADMRFVNPSYFAALRMPLLAGRAFTREDGAGAPKVAIVSRNLAKRLWGDADPIGRRIADGGGKNPVWREVVGVVGEIHANGPGEESPNVLYWSSSQRINPSQTLLVRAGVDAGTLMPSIRRVLAAADPLLAPSSVTTIDAAMSARLGLVTFIRWLFTLLGLTGLVLAAVGVYGVIAYLVAQRTHEFGVRMALGSSGAALQWMVVRQGLMLAGMGVGLGLIGAYAATRLLSTMVFGVTAHDPVTFAVVGGALALVAVGASYIPARRATRIDPLVALRGT